MNIGRGYFPRIIYHDKEPYHGIVFIEAIPVGRLAARQIVCQWTNVAYLTASVLY
jgi:hypothetical protein